MNNFKIVGDESADYAIVTGLRNKGYSVYAISEQLPSISDKEVLSVALENNALLVTEDKDFGELLYNSTTTGVAVCDDGSFYVSDGYGNSRIVKFSPAEKYLFQWGTKGDKEGECNIPHAIDFG